MSLIKTAHRGWVQLGDGLRAKGLVTNKLEGVFRPQSYEDACAETEFRAQIWCSTFLKDNSNGYPRTSEFERKNIMLGAFGEPI
jgi:hypothetical protein